MEGWEKTCGLCEYFSTIPDSDPDGVVTWGNCLINLEFMEEAFHFDDPACEDWKLSKSFS
jgi:hypothetical protein